MIITSCDKLQETSGGAEEIVEDVGEEQENKINGYDFIDLGLSVKWATCNIGAKTPFQTGGYYAWAETEEKYYYSENTYDYYIDGSYM